jgi:hypothetical protein
MSIPKPADLSVTGFDVDTFSLAAVAVRPEACCPGLRQFLASLVCEARAAIQCQSASSATPAAVSASLRPR